jgi:predicted branched-subunit amino acid permease
MPLHVKSISMSISVACLFLISFIGWFAGLEPLICCERALIGAVIAYIVMTVLINVINDILISALVKSRMEKEQGDMNDRGN